MIINISCIRIYTQNFYIWGHNIRLHACACCMERVRGTMLQICTVEKTVDCGRHIHTHFFLAVVENGCGAPDPSPAPLPLKLVELD